MEINNILRVKESLITIILGKLDEADTSDSEKYRQEKVITAVVARTISWRISAT
jgi:hypothetical protein